MKDVSAIIVAADEEERIGLCLESLHWCSEVIVVTNGEPGDRTGELAAACGARVLERPWSGFADQKNFAASQAGGTWILSVDADEKVSVSLAEEIAGLPEDGGGCAAFSIPFQTFLGQRRLHYGGFQDERHVRLWRRGCGRFVGKDGSEVHEHLEIDGDVGRLSAPVLHHTYRNATDYMRKVRLYSAMEARGAGPECRIGLGTWLKPPAVFLKRLLLQKGILDGWAGVVSAACLSCYDWNRARTLVHLRNVRRGKES